MVGPLAIKIKVTHPIAELKPIISKQHKRKNIARLVLYPRKIYPPIKFQENHLVKSDKDCQHRLILRRLGHLT